MQTNNVNSLESFNAIPADEIEKTRKTSINPIIVKQGTGNWFLIPDLHFKNIGIIYQNKVQGTSFRFPISCFRSTVLKYPRRLLK